MPVSVDRPWHSPACLKAPAGPVKKEQPCAAILAPSVINSLQFQGRWYVVGLAGNAVQKEDEGRFTMYSTIYELQEDNKSYNVTSILLR